MRAMRAKEMECQKMQEGVGPWGQCKTSDMGAPSMDASSDAGRYSLKVARLIANPSPKIVSSNNSKLPANLCYVAPKREKHVKTRSD